MVTDNIAMFQKVSFEEYKKARVKMFATEGEYSEEELFEEWKNIKIPQRATIGSAGYDFSIPMEADLSNESVLFPTGIRAKIAEGWVLLLFPRSGLGTKYGFKLDNTTGIIDSDYFYADNEGHIMAKVHTEKPLRLGAGERFMQGVFVPFGIACNGNTTLTRHGGFGSTGTK